MYKFREQRFHFRFQVHPAGIEPTPFSQCWVGRFHHEAMDAERIIIYLCEWLGFGIPSRASISSVKGDSGKDGIGRRVSRTNKIRVEKGEFAKLDKIGMGIGTCIDVPDRLMLPGWCDVFHQLTGDLIIGISMGPARIEIGAGSTGSFWKRSAPR